MGLWPARGNENQPRPRESGDPLSVRMDSRFRGNDLIFRRTAGDEESRSAVKTLRARFLASLGMTIQRKFSHRLRTSAALT